MSDMGSHKPPQDQSSGSGQSVTFRQPNVTDPIASKRVCFYKSGDTQFNGLRMVINNRTFKTFDALLDSLSKKVPLPFGVRNITTPRGVNAIHTLDELEDGKSYICSDRRKVKPINLALASKKPPPWYHARPITARRRALQPARLDPGRPKRKRKQNAMVVRTPKRLTVFRNGDPSVKHTVMLQKRTTPTFESLLNYVSELMQFPVVKLHTPNGGRVDGLPALILCAGRVVAAGREPFKFANYNTQKSTVPNPWLPASRMPSNRKKATRKKRSVSSGTKSRNFSASSERYFVNQIQNSIAGSLCDFPSNPTGSVELENGHRLESVAETEGDNWLEDGGEGVGNCLPLDDDIEKSFRVNQDGSMTVEMKVRLTIKEEETVHWTTTLSRSSVANQPGMASLAESESESLSLQPQDLPHIDIIDRNNSKDDNDLFQLRDGIACEDGIEENDGKTQKDVALPRRTPSPGPRIFRQKQASVESIKTVTAEEIQQNMSGSYSYREETENGKVTEEYCMVRQCSTRPVPKPRAVCSMEINNYNIDQSTFKSNGMTEILQTEDSAQEITETVLHIYEQQTCQDSYHANSEFSVQDVSMYGLDYGRPPTSDTAHFPPRNDWETEMKIPSTASESISVWRTDDMSLLSDLTVPTLKTGKANLPSQKDKVISTLKSPLTKPTKDKESLMSGLGQENSSIKAIQKAEQMSSKPKVKKTQSRQSTTPEKRRKESNADVPEKRKKVKTVFSSAASIRKIYGLRPKAVKNLIKKKRQGTGNGSVQTTNSELPVNIKFNIQNPNKLSTVTEQNFENRNETSFPFKNNVLNDSPSVNAQEKGILTMQKSIHEEKIDRETPNMFESVLLPALNSSPNVSNEYVEQWLEKAHPSPTVLPEDETQNVETNPQMGLKGGILEVSEINCEEIIAAEEKSQVPSVLPLEITSAPNGSLENIAALAQSPSTEKIPSESKNILHCNGSMEDTTIGNGLSTEKTLLLNSTSLDKAPSPTDGKTKPSNQSPLKERSSRNSSVKKTRLVSNTSLERKMSQRKASVEKSAITSDPPLKNTISTPVDIAVENIPLSSSLSSNSTLEKSPLPRNRSFKTTALHNNASLDTTTLPTSPRTKKTSVPSSLSSEQSPAPCDNLLLKRLSPYSQSLELVSPPTTVKLKKKLLTTNHSLDNTADQKTPLPRKNHPTELAFKPLLKHHSASLEKTPVPSPSPLNPEHKLNDEYEISKTGQGNSRIVKEKSSTMALTTTPESLKPATQPDIETVLERLCHSIQTIRYITQNKLASCLEKSNRLPDFSSHVATTFGSSSKALLAFLAVMALKESMANLNMHEKNANCAEALEMMESLREIASIEDADKLKASLTDLQKSTSTQLLQSWKAFQELGDKSKGHSSMPNSSAHNLLFKPCPKIESYLEENNIDELINELDMPEKLKEELAALQVIVRRESMSIEVTKEVESSSNEVIDANSTSVLEEAAAMVNESICNDEPSVDVKSIIKHFMNIQQTKEVIDSNVSPIVDSSHSQQKQLFSENLSLKGDNVCCGDRQSPKEEGYEHVEDYLAEEVQTNSLAAHASCVDGNDLPSSHREENRNLEKEHTEYHTEDKPSYLEPEAKCIELRVSGEENTSSPGECPFNSKEDMISRHEEEAISEENQEVHMRDQLCLEMQEQEVRCTELEFNSKEREPTTETVKDSVKYEEFHADDLGSLGAQIYEEQNKSQHIVREMQSSLVEQSILIGDETICLGKQDNTLEEHYSFDIDKESGNDHVSCEEHTDAAGEANYEDKHCSLEEQASFEGNESGSEEEHINIEQYIEESYTECQESYVEEQLSEEETNNALEVSEEKNNYEMNEVKTAFHSEETPAHSVAVRVTLLEKKVAGLDQRRTVIVETPGIKRLAQIEVPIASEIDDLTNVSQLSNYQAQVDEFMSETLRTTHSAPQSSLAFSYDSNSSSPRDREGNRVKSLKEMFMAKSIADIQHGHRRPPSPNSSDLSDSRPQTSDSGGHPSKTSPEVSSEDESLLKSIAKGIVRRTIERLYGKKDDNIKDSDVERPLSAPKVKLRENIIKSIFSPIHTTPTKVVSDLSYFNATNSFESNREPTRCVAFNAQVAPGDSVDAGRWLFKENTPIRKSISEPTTINKGTGTCTKTEKECGHTEEDVPYSHFSRTSPERIMSSELEDKVKPVALKCTYFTLPHGRDSDLYQDEMSTAIKSANEGDLTKEKQDKTEEESKTWVEKHVTLPDFTSTDFKKLDNKVHPLTEGPTEGPVVVVVQPGKGQTALKGQTAVNRRPQEPDVLEVLYVFCGQHCPIL